MPPEANSQIDTEQGKISAQAAKERTELQTSEFILADSQYQNTFINKVDNFQSKTLDQKIPTEAQKYLDSGKTQVGGILKKAASRGAQLFDQQKANKKLQEDYDNALAAYNADPQNKEKPKQPKLKTVTGDSLNAYQSDLDNKLSSYSENLERMIQIEKQFEEKKLETAKELITQKINSGIDSLTLGAFTSELSQMLDQGLGDIGELRRTLDSNPNLPKEYLAAKRAEIKKQYEFLAQKKMVHELYRHIFTSGNTEYITISANSKNPLNPHIRFSETFKKLPPERRQEILSRLAFAKIQIAENIESLTHPKITENFWKGKKAFESGDQENALKFLTEFVQKDINSPEFQSDPVYQREKENYRQRAQQMIDKINESNTTNKEFFEAQKLLASGDFIAAKKLLLVYYNRISKEPKIEGKTDFRESAREMLLKICQIQFQQVREQFSKFKEPQQFISVQGGEKGERRENPAWKSFQTAKENISKLGTAIQSGDYLDFDDAVRKTIGEQAFSPDSEYSLIADQLELGKGKEGLLSLARKYRALGQTDLAAQYFESYFSEQLNQIGASVTIESLRLKYDANPKFHIELKEKVDQAEKEYLQRFGEDYVKKNPFDRQKARAAFETAMLQEIRPREIKMKQQDIASQLPPDLQPIWKEFAQMEGYAAREIAGVKLFALTDAELHELMVRIPIEIAIIAVSGGVGAAAGRFATGAITRFGLSESAAIAAEFGVSSAGRRFAGYAGGLLVENTAFTASSTLLHAAESGNFTFDAETFAHEWTSGLTVLGGLGLSGRLGRGLGAGHASGLALELTTMGAMHGQLTMHDIAIVLGLKLGHGAFEKISPAKPEGLQPMYAKKALEVVAAREALIPVRSPLSPKAGEGPGVRAESAETRTETSPETRPPRTEFEIGGRKVSKAEAEAATSEKPLDPYSKETREYQKYTEEASFLDRRTAESVSREAQRQNPGSTPEIQQAWGEAYLDAATGLYNRNGFKFAERWLESKKQTSVASFDGDFFGAFNKLKGTEFGDYIIKAIGHNFQKLSAQLREMGYENVIIREGGEEFTVMVKEMPASKLSEVMENFRRELQSDLVRRLDEVNPNLKSELMEYLIATGKLSKYDTPAEYLARTGEMPIGGSTIGIAETPRDLAASKIPPEIMLDRVKRHADQALEKGKTTQHLGRNKTYTAAELSLAQFEAFTAESSLSHERAPNAQKSQAENLQDIFTENKEAIHDQLNDITRVRGYNKISVFIEKLSIEAQRQIQKILSHEIFQHELIQEFAKKFNLKVSEFVQTCQEFHLQYLDKIASFDPLTGTANSEGYRKFKLKRAMRGEPFQSYDIDIKLKSVNETMGHVGGDAYLMLSARVLRDIIGRIEGTDPKKIALFRKAPFEGSGFRIASIGFEFSPAQLQFIAREYSAAMQKQFYDHIGSDPAGKSARDRQSEWVAKESKAPETDLASIGEISIRPETASKSATGETAASETAPKIPETSSIPTHYQSTFSRAEIALADSVAHLEGGRPITSPEKIAGWIDRTGQIHYNATYFEAKFSEMGLKLETREGRNIFLLRGVEMSPMQFFRTAEGRQVLAEMKRVKAHEVTHRLVEVINEQSAGELAKKLVEISSTIPELTTFLTATGKEINFENIQEFLSQIAEGRHQLNPQSQARIESVISEFIPGFSFQRVRTLDTQLLAATQPAELTRGFIDHMTTGEQIQMPGSRYDGYYIAGVFPDGRLMLSQIAPTPSGRLIGTTVTTNEVLIGTKHKGRYIHSISPEGIVTLSTISPNAPNALTAAHMFSRVPLTDVISRRSAEKGQISLGDSVSVFNSSGNKTYDNWTVIDIAPNGKVTIQGIIGGKIATKQYESVAELHRQTQLLEGVRRMPLQFDLVNSSGLLDRGWKIESVNIENGGLNLAHPDGRKFIVENLNSLTQLISGAENLKQKTRAETSEALQKIPPEFDLIFSDGNLYEKMKVESVDYETGLVKIKTRDGRLGLNIHINALAHEIIRTREALSRQPAIQPVQGPEIPSQYQRNEIQRSPEQVPRASDVLMVGDLHGNYDIFVRSLAQLGIIPSTGEIRWTGGNKKLVFHGDILADRNISSLKIMEAISKLQAEAAKAGGDVSLIAGNHEDFAFSFLTGKKVAGGGSGIDVCFINGQGAGMLEFFQKFSPNPRFRAATKLNDILFSPEFNSAETPKELLEAMRVHPEGRKLLEQMASSFKLAEYIDDTLYIHTEPTTGILQILETTAPTIGQSVDRINAIYRQGLRFILLGEGSMPPEFTTVSDTFLHTENRDFKPRRGLLAPLQSRGLNHIVHGHSHSNVGSNVSHSPEGVAIIGVDHSAGKRATDPVGDLSIGRISQTRGQISDN